MTRRTRPITLSFGASPLAFLLACTALAALVMLPGCGGCRQGANNQNSNAEEEEKEKEKEKPKPDFEFSYKDGDENIGMRVLPGTLANYVKPGHWMGMTQPVKANNYDFAGELRSAAIDSERRPLTLERTPFRLQLSRPVALAKEQLKHLEMQVFIPRRQRQGGKKAYLSAELRDRRTGRVVMQPTRDPTTTMEAHHFYIVALVRRPADYNFVTEDNFYSVKAPEVGDFISSIIRHYTVIVPNIEQNVQLPSNPLLWTSIAYIIWDDINPDELTLDQQDALVDWLHWGGSMIISGPGSISTLKNSFLKDYLPALPGETEKLTQDRFDEINEHFTLPGDKKRLYPLFVSETTPPEGVKLKLQADGKFMPKTGNLVAERQIGRGRIVVSAFSLSHPQIQGGWPGYDGFFNACFLKRPAREFSGNANAGAVGMRFSRDSLAYIDQTVDLKKDPRLTSGLRYFSRDAGQSSGGGLDAPPLFDRGFQRKQESGVAGWDDFSAVSNAARDSLKAAAGITVPERGFVLRVLAVYLFVLVPANWTLFKAIGRVEWAWAAAPIIAIGGAFWVIHAAQLDIGFARSRTEVALLELQPGHARGHLTRYMALYTSLSTRYDVTFDDKNALAQPFCTDPDFQFVAGQTPNTVTFNRDNEASLRGFQIASNSTSMLHSEEQRSFGGPIEFQQLPERGPVVINKSGLTLKDVGVIRRLPDRRGASAIQVAWVGELKPESNFTLNFAPATDANVLLTQWEESSTTMNESPPNEVSLNRFLQLARDPRRLMPGDVKLIGWTDEELGGVELSPSPRQNLARTLVVANLQYQALAPPTPDVNTFDAVSPPKNPLP